MKRYTKDQTEQLSFLNSKEVKQKIADYYGTAENTVKGNNSELNMKEMNRYPFYKKVLAYKLELY